MLIDLVLCDEENAFIYKSLLLSYHEPNDILKYIITTLQSHCVSAQLCPLTK